MVGSFLAFLKIELLFHFRNTFSSKWENALKRTKAELIPSLINRHGYWAIYLVFFPQARSRLPQVGLGLAVLLMMT